MECANNYATVLFIAINAQVNSKGLMSDASAIADGGCVCVTMIALNSLPGIPRPVNPPFSTAKIGRKNAWACKLSSGSEVMRIFFPMLSKPGAAVH